MSPAAGSRNPAPRRAEQIAAATIDLLVERSYDGLTIEAVAERAGVNKTTIYRWWPSKAELVGSATVTARALRFDLPDTGSVRGDLCAYARHVADLLTRTPTAQVAHALLAGAGRSPELAENLQEYVTDRIERARPMMARAVARGEIRPDTDVGILLELLNGAVWLHAVVRRLPIDDGLLEAWVDGLVSGFADGPTDREDLT